MANEKPKKEEAKEQSRQCPPLGRGGGGVTWAATVACMQSVPLERLGQALPWFRLPFLPEATSQKVTSVVTLAGQRRSQKSKKRSREEEPLKVSLESGGKANVHFHLFPGRNQHCSETNESFIDEAKSNFQKKNLQAGGSFPKVDQSNRV